MDRELKREAKRVGLSHRNLFDHYRPRKKGRDGHGYSAAATIEQRRALLKWEESAAAVEQAQREMERQSLPSRFDDPIPVGHYPVDKIVADIAYIKMFYRNLSRDQQELHKKRLAAKIDVLLGELRTRY